MNGWIRDSKLQPYLWFWRIIGWMLYDRIMCFPSSGVNVPWGCLFTLLTLPCEDCREKTKFSIRAWEINESSHCSGSKVTLWPCKALLISVANRSVLHWETLTPLLTLSFSLILSITFLFSHWSEQDVCYRERELNGQTLGLGGNWCKCVSELVQILLLPDVTCTWKQYTTCSLTFALGRRHSERNLFVFFKSLLISSTAICLIAPLEHGVLLRWLQGAAELRERVVPVVLGVVAPPDEDSDPVSEEEGCSVHAVQHGG